MKLPVPEPIEAPLGNAIRERKSIRKFTGQQISLEQLSQILYIADGMTHTEKGFKMRSAASGGALYPIDTYIYASGIESLAKGIYLYDVDNHGLVEIRPGDFSNALHKASLKQDCVGSSPLTIILVAYFERCTKKYGERGRMYTYQESGSISQNIYLAATALGLGTVAVGAFTDADVGKILGLDEKKETAVMLMPVGYPAEK